MNTNKPILCLGFDGVLHECESGWNGVDVISDGPVPGACAFLLEAAEKFDVHIYSSRSAKVDGIAAMQAWLHRHMTDHMCAIEADPDPDIHPAEKAYDFVHNTISWPMEKPPAMVTLDDRAVTFTGEWPDVPDLLSFMPWNKKRSAP